MPSKKTYAEVILPVPVPGTFTYAVPEQFQDRLETGVRVWVPFGKKKYSGIVYRLAENPPHGFEVKEIESLLETFPVVASSQIKFWEWLAGYYLCHLGEVYNAALPSGLKLESETWIRVLREFLHSDHLTEEEEILFNTVKSAGEVRQKDYKKTATLRKKLKVLQSLVDKGVLVTEERSVQKFRPKTVEFVSVPGIDDDALTDTLDRLNKAPKQQQLLLSILNAMHGEDEVRKELSKPAIRKLKGFSDNSLRSLKEKGIITTVTKEVSRLYHENGNLMPPKPLSAAQQDALDLIRSLFKEKEAVLLQGVTSSGKTEIYFHLIQEQLEQGKQVLYLMPEIALTTQIISRLRETFGGSVGIYHSRYSDAERVETYLELLNKDDGEIKIVLGARSAIFLPFTHLGLIIVDEEHENTYKQYDPSPRYQARDAALVLARIHGARVLHGTATPSLESYYNAHTGKYGLVRLEERYTKVGMPEIRVANLTEQYRKKLMKSHFSSVLMEEIQNSLENNQQIILFQNRRGFSLYLECESCGWIPRCRACDVSLTYHKSNNRLVCHYCGYSTHLPAVCPDCNQPALKTKGFGTEKVEDEIGILFPEARIKRFDLDTARTRKQYEQIIADFESGAIDILIGTQIISKGMDFENVNLVGILNADNLLNFPDFRAQERSFQLIAQVSGRAGRREKRGRVIIQSFDPANEVIKYIRNNDFEAVYRTLLMERKEFRYPPYYRLIRISFRHRKSGSLVHGSDQVINQLRQLGGMEILGPQSPIVSRIKNMLLRDALIKIPRSANLSGTKNKIRAIVDDTLAGRRFPGLQIVIDVDPY